MNGIYYNFWTCKPYCSLDEFVGKALELYINLQSPEEIMQLEEDLRLVLLKKEKFYKRTDEHTKVFADSSRTYVKLYIIPGEKEPIKGEYSTLSVYELACDYNLTRKNMGILLSGGHITETSREELKRKMDLVTAEAGE